MKKNSEDLGVAVMPYDSSAAPSRVRLMRKEGASELPPSVAPRPCISNSDEDAVMKSESPVQSLKSNQNSDMPSLSDSKGKAIPSDSGTINLPSGMLWDVDIPPLKKRMKRSEVSSFTTQGCRYYLRPR